jgi:WD40 repeat protein
MSHIGYILSTAFSASGKRLFSGSLEGRINVWDVPTGNLINQWPAHHGPVNDIKVSSNGEWLATSSRDTTVKIWGSESENPIQTFVGHDAGVNAATFLRDKIASASHDGSIRVWDIQSGQQVHRLDGHEDAVLDVAYLWDNLIASVSRDLTVRLWDVSTGTQIKVMLGHRAWVTKVRALTNRKQIITTDEMGRLNLWKPETGELIRGWSNKGHHPIWGFDVSPDNRLAVSHPDLWDLLQPENSTNLGTGYGTRAIAVSRDSKRVACGDDLSDIYIKNLETRRVEVKCKGGSNLVISSAISENGQRIATGHADGKLSVRNLDGSHLQKTSAHSFMAYALTTSSSGYLISGGFDGKICRWDFDSLTRTQTYDGGGLVFSVQRPAGSPYLLTTGNSYFNLWDEDSGDLVAKTKVDGNNVHLFATYMPDRNYIATAGDDNVVRLFSVESNQPTAEVKLPVGNTSAICSLDEDRVLVATADGFVFCVNFPNSKVDAKYIPNEDWIRKVIVTDDQHHAYTSCQDGYTSVIDLTTSETKPILENYRPISTLALSHGELVMMDAEDNIIYPSCRFTGQ